MRNFSTTNQSVYEFFANQMVCSRFCGLREVRSMVPLLRKLILHPRMPGCRVLFVRMMFWLFNQGQQCQSSCRDSRFTQLGRLALFVCPAWELALALPFPEYFRLYECLGLVCSCVLSHFISVWPFVTPWTVARHALLSMGFSRQRYWSGLPCPPPGDLPDLGIETMSLTSPALQADSLLSEPPGKD